MDARGADISFQILVRRQTKYVAVKPRDGWHPSPLFGWSFRLVRQRNRLGRWQDRLLVKQE